MMLLFAHLLNLNPEWRQAKVRLRTIVSSEAEQEPMHDKLNSMLVESRLSVECDVILNKDNANVADLMHQSSKDADMVFLGLALPERSNDTDFAQNLDKLVTGFNSTILVRNAESTQGELIE
jgi:hypothetical protein